MAVLAGVHDMALDLPTLRKLVSMDVNDPLSRFALGRKLAEVATGENSPELVEAAEHLSFANQKSPGHLATYHVLSEVLIRLNRRDEARRVLTEGIRRVGGVGEGMGRDLGPAMQKMLDAL
jgi:tetratricopeptide repeat protein